MRDPQDWPWWARTLPALGVTSTVAAAIAVAWPGAWWRCAALAVSYLATPVGQEVWVVVGHLRFGLPYAGVAALLWLVNLAVALFFGLAVPVERAAARLPWLGRRLERFGRRVQASRLATANVALALACAVALPIHSGGAVVGTLAGRLLGLRWWVAVAAVMAAVGLRIGVALLLAIGLLPH